jgi:hypothetical protein
VTVYRTSDDVVGPPAQEVDRSVRTTSTYWSPAQIVAILIGLGFVVMGIAAIARTGFHTAHIYTPHARVWTFWHSPLLGLIEIGFGALMLIAGCVPGAARALMAFLGAVALGFGITIVVDAAPHRLAQWFAVTHRNGWLYVAVGGFALLVALIVPAFGGTTRQRADYEVVRA